MMIYNNDKRFFVFAALFLLGATAACATPTTQTMVDTDIIGDRTVKYMLLEPGRTASEDAMAQLTDSDVTEFHFTLRVCDIGDDHQETNCADSTVLRQVTMNPDPEDTSEVDGRRSVTTLFWYDSHTLYVGYLERPESGENILNNRPQPRVRMCRIGDDNSLDCHDQQAINQLLEVEG